MEHYIPDLKFPEFIQYLELCSRSPDDAGGICSGSGFLPLFPLLYPQKKRKRNRVMVWTEHS